MNKQSYLTVMLIGALLCGHIVSAQDIIMEGSTVITDSIGTRLTVKSLSETDNALIRFGNEDVSKFSMGYQGGDDLFVLARGTDLSDRGFTMGNNTFSNRFAINADPTSNRLFIFHNSTSGVPGSAHLVLEENGTSDYARLRFKNIDNEANWTLAARAATDPLLRFNYNDGSSGTNIFAIDGALERVGIHTESPEAYLHIKQETAGVDALKFENDESTGGEIWGMRIGDNDILVYFEGDLRGSFNSDDGVYTNFPPPPSASRSRRTKSNSAVNTYAELRNFPEDAIRVDIRTNHLELDPQAIAKYNPDWVVRSEDGERLGVNMQHYTAVLLESARMQQQLIDELQKEIELLKTKTQN